MWGSLGLSPVIGRLIDKLNNRELFIAAGGVLIAAAILIMAHIEMILFPLLVLVISVAFVPAPIFSFPSKILRPENLGLGFGILTMVSSLDMFFGPSLVGFLRDSTGSYRIGFTFMSVFSLLMTCTAVIIRKRLKKEFV